MPLSCGIVLAHALLPSAQVCISAALSHLPRTHPNTRQNPFLATVETEGNMQILWIYRHITPHNGEMVQLKLSLKELRCDIILGDAQLPPILCLQVSYMELNQASSCG